jgi:hypothetical protein
LGPRLRAAADVEALVAEALGKLSSDRAALQTDIRNLIDRVVIGRATIRIQLSEVVEENDSARILTVPWTRPSPGALKLLRRKAPSILTGHSS